MQDAPYQVAIVVMDGGTIQQVGSPSEVYERPANLFVAGFVGIPSMNTIQGMTTDGMFRASTGQLPTGGIPDRETVIAGIRSEDLVLRPNTVADDGIAGQVRLVELIGSDKLVQLETVVGMLVSDILLAVLDPRIRLAGGAAR